MKGFSIDKKSFCARAAVVCMLLAVVFRVIGCFDLVLNFNSVTSVTVLILPVACCLVFVLCIVLIGKKGFWFSFLPVLLGMVFFVLRALTDDNMMGEKLPVLHIAVCIVLYLVILVLYSCTVFGAIKTKWICALIFLLAFAYHVVMEDYPNFRTATMNQIMNELSVLLIILGMFFACLGLKKLEKPVISSTVPVAPPLPGGNAAPSAPVEAAAAQDVPAEDVAAQAAELAAEMKPESTESSNDGKEE